ncbi:EamA family transporter [Lysobacter arenosi]|uniref:EamA family transporter n=1 Tax=Lysobacter arenosi TaxID=2795387 RepID=A0ABX7R632_9GAMM|nr:EamA family transporter [Lysobacter arenosi]
MVIPNSWVFWALMSAVFAAMTAILAKAGVENVDSDFAMAVRTVIVAAVIVPFVMMAGKWSNPLSLQASTLALLTASALATGASWFCYFRALQAGPVSMVAPVDKFSVVLVALFAFTFLGERPAAREWAGISLVTAGLVLLVFRR